MNVDQYLEATRQENALEVESQGEFRLALPKLLDKLSESALTRPELAPLALIAAGVTSGITRINISQTRKGLVYHLVGEEPDLSSIHTVCDSLFGQRLLWAMAVQKAKSVSVSSGRQRQRLILSGGSHKIEADCIGLELLTIEVKGSFASIYPLLLRHCPLCPIPLLLDGKQLQNPLPAKHSRVSPTVPPLFRGGATTRIDSQLAVALGPSTNSVWVAVVGGLSYPFRLETKASGILWDDNLKVDAGLQNLVCDSHWERNRDELLRLAQQV